MRSAVVVGNPRPRSRTYQAACLVAERLTDTRPELIVDLADLGAALLDPADASVASLIDALAACDLIIFASPTFKASTLEDWLGPARRQVAAAIGCPA